MTRQSILLTIDVEDWFQVENFKSCIPFSSWDSRELRVERNVHRLLDLFDSVHLPPTTHQNVRCTFFILGWIAERLPNMVREIHGRGHEVASHGCNHELSNQMDRQALKEDLIRSKKLLEDIVGHPVSGYRAPSFAINDEVLHLIGECGYAYDSSYNSFQMNRRYGSAALNCSSESSVACAISENLTEIPISNFKIDRWVVPMGGGGYFRLLPYSLFREGVQRILRQDGAYVFYCHPWEFDPRQPRVRDASPLFKFRHYTNLNSAYTKLKRLIRHFSSCRFPTCRQYLDAARNG